MNASKPYSNMNCFKNDFINLQRIKNLITSKDEPQVNDIYTNSYVIHTSNKLVKIVIIN